MKRILTDPGGHTVPCIFTTSSGLLVVSVTCNALAVKHHVTWNASVGDRVHGRNIRITVSELALNDLSYPVRDTNNRVSMIGHRVAWTDISGVQATYIIEQQFPNEMTGMIRCQLGDYGTVTPPGRVFLGWMYNTIQVQIVSVVNPLNVQTLGNGDIIPVEYTINVDGTLTIPYLGQYQCQALTPMFVDNETLQNVPYDITTGTFNNSAYGGFIEGNALSVNASIPVWQS